MPRHAERKSHMSLQNAVRAGVAIVLAMMLMTTAGGCAPSESEVPGVESLSTDDVKDVFEGIQFIAITLGIATAMYWFYAFKLPRERSARVEFDIGVSTIGHSDGKRLIEVAATLCNGGSSRIELVRCGFSLQSVHADTVDKAGPLLGTNAVAPLFEFEWPIPVGAVEGYATATFTCPASVPAEVQVVIVTGHFRHTGQAETVAISRIVALS